MASLVDDLLLPDAFGPGTGRASLVETHVSRVFLCEHEVFKTKRAVSLGFVDFRTLEARRRACEAELTLNRRLAPSVYRGLVSIHRTPDGRHVADGPGEPVEWAVRMVRLSDAKRADVRLARGELTGDAVERIAEKLAAFHATAATGETIATAGLAESVRRNVQENIEATRACVLSHLDAAGAAELERFQVDFLLRNGPLMAGRALAGRIRDGHGDLRLEHVYLDGEVTVIDCVEFADRYRHGDVCSDLSFLSMDLAWHGRADLAERLLARYARESGDFELYRLADFYESYRAHVRAKIACLLAADEEALPAARSRGESEARRYFLVALAAGRRPATPAPVVVVSGIIGSGKSTVAAALGAALPAAVVEADRTRKQLAGLPVHARAPQSIYDPVMTRRTYDEMYRRAAAVLDSGRPVILDGSFRSAAERAAARELAVRRGLPFRLIECHAPLDVLRERLAAREGVPGPSDARVDLLDSFSRDFEPVTELPAHEHVVVDTRVPLDENLARLRASVPGWR